VTAAKQEHSQQMYKCQCSRKVLASVQQMKEGLLKEQRQAWVEGRCK
jgi:hypothetical protein